jgi:hypothetical protein
LATQLRLDQTIPIIRQIEFDGDRPSKLRVAEADLFQKQSAEGFMKRWNGK